MNKRNDQYYKKFEDIMAFVAQYGKPHLWIIHTLNVGCDDVGDPLWPGEQPWVILQELVPRGIFHCTKREQAASSISNVLIFQQ